MCAPVSRSAETFRDLRGATVGHMGGGQLSRMEQSQTSLRQKSTKWFSSRPLPFHKIVTFYTSFEGRGTTLHDPHGCPPRGRTGSRQERGCVYLVGIFARFRAMASSTAFSCFSSSSRRDSVLLGLPEPELATGGGPGAAGFPGGAAGPFPEDLGGGDRGRFLWERSWS